jgi:hypothetical protein
MGAVDEHDRGVVVGPKILGVTARQTGSDRCGGDRGWVSVSVSL